MSDNGPRIEFDHHGPDYAANSTTLNQRLAATCPVAFTEAHGGYWVVTGYDAVAAAARNDEVFSSHHDLPNGSSPFHGAFLPAMPWRGGFMEMDPAEAQLWRRPLQPRFSPAGIERWTERARLLASWCLDRRIESGSMEVIEDFSGPVTAIVTLELLGVPATSWRDISHANHSMGASVPGSLPFLEAAVVMAELYGAIPSLVQQRRLEPADDLLSLFASIEIDGEPATDDQIVEMCILIIGGGVDTTSALVAQAVNYLACNPRDRERLIADPNLIPFACEEFLRYFTPIQCLARTATRDAVLEGVEIKQHDRVLLSWAGANLDPRVWEEPEQIIIDRAPNRHTAFGLGFHRCLGASLARAQFEVMLREILQRIPDFQIAGAVERYECLGMVNGIVELPIRFTAGPRVGASVDELEETAGR